MRLSIHGSDEFRTETEPNRTEPNPNEWTRDHASARRLKTSITVASSVVSGDTCTEVTATPPSMRARYVKLCAIPENQGPAVVRLYTYLPIHDYHSRCRRIHV